MFTIQYSFTLLTSLLLCPVLTDAQSYFSFGPATPLNPHTSTCEGSDASCSTIGEPSWCCPDTERCAFDDDGDVACCPYGDSCRGVINYGSGAEPAPTLGGSETTPTPAPLVAARTTVDEVPETIFPSGSASGKGDPLIMYLPITNNNNWTNVDNSNNRSDGNKDQLLGMWCAWLGVGIILFWLLGG